MVRPALQVGVLSHAGSVRTENQDRMTQFNSVFGEVFIVADGMGGHLGGATASSMVVALMQECLAQPIQDQPLAAALTNATEVVNRKVFQHGHSGDPLLAGMGSTMVAVVVTPELELVVGSVGDSRAYLFREGRLQRITKDHTRVQQYVDAGMISEADARVHPEASFLTRAIGQKGEVLPEIFPAIQLQVADIVLLCSDGLCGYVEDSEIERTLRQFGKASQDAAKALVELALAAGGEDNVTVQLAQAVGAPGRVALPVMLAAPTVPMTASRISNRSVPEVGEVEGPAAGAPRFGVRGLAWARQHVLAVAAVFVVLGAVGGFWGGVGYSSRGKAGAPAKVAGAPASELAAPVAVPTAPAETKQPVAATPAATVPGTPSAPAGTAKVATPGAVAPTLGASALGTAAPVPVQAKRVILLGEGKNPATSQAEDAINAMLPGGIKVTRVEIGEHPAVASGETVVSVKDSSLEPLADDIATALGGKRHVRTDAEKAAFKSADILVVLGASTAK